LWLGAFQRKKQEGALARSVVDMVMMKAVYRLSTVFGLNGVQYWSMHQNVLTLSSKIPRRTGKMRFQTCLAD
jgi:hypothetical protein